MTAKDLKNALLQEAVQGKLVPPACRQAGKLQAKIPSAKDGQWFVYVIECEDGSFYKGFTTDLQKRYEQHCNGTGADWTKTHKPKQLYYWEIHYSEESALQREKYLKSGVGREWFKNEVVDKPENWSSARDLLEEIRKEKAKLVKEGKIKKDTTKASASGRALPEITEDDIPFDIPENWCWCRLNDLCELIEDCPHSTAKDEGKGFPLIRTPNIGEGRLIFENVHRVSKKVYDERNFRAIPKENDLIFAREAPAGNIAVIQKDEIVCLGQRTVLIRPLHEILNSDFLAYYILSPDTQKNLVCKAAGTTVAHVNMSDIRSFPISLPPLAEQKRIVAAIEKFMPLIEEYGKKETELKAFNEQIGTLTKKAILQEAVQGKLIPTCLPAGRQIAAEGNAKDLLEEIKKEKNILIKEGKIKKEKPLPEITEDEIPFDIPESWCWCRLGECVNDCYQGINTAGVHTKFVLSDGVPIIQTGDMSDGKIDISKTKLMSFSDYEIYKDKYQPQYDDIFYCNIGTIGKPLIYRENYTMLFHWNLFIFKYNKYKLIPEYLKLVLEWITSFFEKNTDGTAMQFVSKKKIVTALIPLPPLAEQKRIVAAIEKILPLCEKLGV